MNPTAEQLNSLGPLVDDCQPIYRPPARALTSFEEQEYMRLRSALNCHPLDVQANTIRSLRAAAEQKRIHAEWTDKQLARSIRYWSAVGLGILALIGLGIYFMGDI